MQWAALDSVFAQCVDELGQFVQDAEVLAHRPFQILAERLYQGFPGVVGPARNRRVSLEFREGFKASGHEFLAKRGQVGPESGAVVVPHPELGQFGRSNRVGVELECGPVRLTSIEVAQQGCECCA